jgi:hypothetical protein
LWGGGRVEQAGKDVFALTPSRVERFDEVVVDSTREPLGIAALGLA